jgi:hypothetical protein
MELFVTFFDDFAGASPSFNVHAPPPDPASLTEGDLAELVDALDRAARAVQGACGAMAVQWGKVHRVRGPNSRP